MRLLKIESVKEMMNDLLRGTRFDTFCAAEITIKNRISYVIDGHLIDGGGECTDYSLVRPLCFEMIRGRQLPDSFRFVLFLPKSGYPDFLTAAGISADPESIGALNLTIRFQERELFVMTGTAMKVFTTDRSLEDAWDRYVQNFLKEYGPHE